MLGLDSVVKHGLDRGGVEVAGVELFRPGGRRGETGGLDDVVERPHVEVSQDTAAKPGAAAASRGHGVILTRARDRCGDPSGSSAARSAVRVVRLGRLTEQGDRSCVDG